MAGDLKRLSDDELLRRCNSGDRNSATAAFAELYKRYKPFVLRVAMATVRDAPLATDAMQDVFTWLLKEFPPTGNGVTLTAKFTSFLYPAARNAAISHLRKAQRLAADVEPDSLAIASTDESSDVDSLLRILPPTSREITTMRYLHDMSVADIAAALDIPPGTVKSRLNTAVRQLRNSSITKHFFEK